MNPEVLTIQVLLAHLDYLDFVLENVPDGDPRKPFAFESRQWLDLLIDAYMLMLTR